MFAPLSWSAGTNLLVAEAGIVAQPYAGNTVVLGGPSTDSYNLNATDPSWQATTSPTTRPLDVSRTSPGVGVLANGYLLVFGGTQNGFATSGVIQYDPNGATVTDGATNQTRALRAMSTPRGQLGWATNKSTFVSYAIGGVDNNGTALATVESYNATTNTWTLQASLPQTLFAESAVADTAGHIFVMGGVGANGAISKNVYRYTVATNTWAQVASMQVGVRDSAAVLGSNGLIYVIGGKSTAGATATVESYNITTNTWTIETSLPQPLSSEAASVDALGRIEVIGGLDTNNNPVATIYVSQKLAQPDATPVITSAAVTASVVNSPYSYQVLATGNPQPTFSLSAAPAGMTIDSNTGLISWLPNYATEGIKSVAIVATSAAGQSSQTFSVNVAPITPTGLSGTGLTTSSVSLSWNASADPNVTGYNVYRRTVLHDPKGSGSHFVYSRIASNITSNGITISGTTASGVYLVSAVNSAGLESARSGVVSVSVLSAPSLWGAMTTGGAVVSSLPITLRQTGQVYLLSYGNPPPTYSVVNGPSNVSVDANTGLVTYVPRPSDVGNQVITFLATNSVGSSTNTFTFAVSALTPKLTINSPATIYDGALHVATATAVGDDGITPVAGTFDFTYNGVGTPPSDVGTYAVVANFHSADPFYADQSLTSTLTISPAVPTINLAAGPYNFDQNSHAATATAIGLDGITQIDGTFNFSYDGSATPPSAPGLHLVAATFTSNDPRYASTTATGNLIINSQGTLVPQLSLNNASRPFDGSAQSPAATAVGIDNSTPVAGAFIYTYNGSSIAPTQAGTYSVVANFISADSSYANATTTGTLTITQATPTLAISQTWANYDTLPHAVTVHPVGVDLSTAVAGSIAISYNGSTSVPTDAGTYEVAVSFVSNDPNYTSTKITSSFTILPAMPYVGISSDWNSTYDGTPHSAVGSAINILGTSQVSGTFVVQYFERYGAQNLLAGPPTDAGYYSVVVYFTSQDPNYSSGFYQGDFNILSAEPDVVITGGPFVYNGTARPATVTAFGVDGVTPIAGVATVTYNGSTTVPTLAGTYDVHAEFSSSDVNYYGSYSDSTLVITKATPSFASLLSPTVNVGATSVTVTGRIAAGTAVPSGDAVAVTLNGVTQAAIVSGTGSFTTTFNITGLAAGSYNFSFAFMGDAARFEAAATSTSKLTVQAPVSILSNPANQTVVTGSKVTFVASASGYPVPTVQWQVSTNGTTYTNIAGATSTTFTLSSVTNSQNGYRFRAVFTNSAGAVNTTAAILTVQWAPIITTNPTSQTVRAGQNVSFVAAATGTPAPTVQWQVSINGGVSFTNISGATSPTLTFATTVAQRGYRYRAVFTNSLGSAVTTAATLTV